MLAGQRGRIAVNGNQEGTSTPHAVPVGAFHVDGNRHADLFSVGHVCNQAGTQRRAASGCCRCQPVFEPGHGGYVSIHGGDRDGCCGNLVAGIVGEVHGDGQ